jgi:hypothetical protein
MHLFQYLISALGLHLIQSTSLELKQATVAAAMKKETLVPEETRLVHSKIKWKSGFKKSRPYCLGMAPIRSQFCQVICKFPA